MVGARRSFEVEHCAVPPRRLVLARGRAGCSGLKLPLQTAFDAPLTAKDELLLNLPMQSPLLPNLADFWHRWWPLQPDV